jgi:hypothetical protein
VGEPRLVPPSSDRAAMTWRTGSSRFPDAAAGPAASWAQATQIAPERDRRP